MGIERWVLGEWVAVSPTLILLVSMGGSAGVSPHGTLAASKSLKPVKDGPPAVELRGELRMGSHPALNWSQEHGWHNLFGVRNELVTPEGKGTVAELDPQHDIWLEWISPAGTRKATPKRVMMRVEVKGSSRSFDTSLTDFRVAIRPITIPASGDLTRLRVEFPSGLTLSEPGARSADASVHFRVRVREGQAMLGTYAYRVDYRQVSHGKELRAGERPRFMFLKEYAPALVSPEGAGRK